MSWHKEAIKDLIKWLRDEFLTEQYKDATYTWGVGDSLDKEE